MPYHPIDRRTFLIAAGAAPTAALTHRNTARPGSPEDLAAFGRLVDIPFTEPELRQAERQLDRLRSNYRSLRKAKITFALPPCASFDPFPHSATKRPATQPREVDIPLDVALPASDTDLAFASVLDLASLLRQRKITSRKITQLALDRLRRFHPKLLCVVNLLTEEALKRADEMDAELANGKDRGVLHGIPYGAKDLFAWPSAPTTFGAEPFKDQVWDQKATPLLRLESAGAVLCAKLSLGALAMGDLWHGGKTRNPYQPTQGSSGSSAGSASAVAAGLLPFALGTETLGSIVSPCRRCGVGGLRPTFGAVSRHGAMPLSWTMDKVGPIARTATDAGVIFDAIRGDDQKDPSARNTSFDWEPSRGLKSLRIGVLKLSGWNKGDDVEAFLNWLTDQGKTIHEVELPNAKYGAMLLMLNAEAAAAFDEFTRSGLDDQLPGQANGDWPNQFRSARTIPAVEYIQASRLRHQLVQDMHEALKGIDVLISPTHGGPTLTATNLSGHPTYVLPIGQSAREGDGGRPTMLALTGQLDGEGALLSVAEEWQKQTTWHQARPDLTNR
jgi:Asp-tRNA(Asn)/Glu-tRNA(Gln) amidotransferase A subunit family amidase